MSDMDKEDWEVQVRAPEGETAIEREFWERLGGTDADAIDWMNFRRILDELKAEACQQERKRIRQGVSDLWGINGPGAWDDERGLTLADLDAILADEAQEPSDDEVAAYEKSARPR